ncbi:MAG: response regulator [Verrucomicrobiia bacterium]
MGALPVLLLVEDNEDDVFLMRRAMRTAEILSPMHLASDGRQALDYFGGVGKYADRSTYPLPAVVFLDIKLPLASGLDVLRWLREQPELRKLIVIMLTSSNYPDDVRQAYHLGANSYVVKPATFQQLVEFAEAFKRYWLTCNRTPL